MMSLRQRHIDPQLAMGSQRLVESSLLAGQQGEGSSFPPRSRPSFRQSRSQSFGQLDFLPLPPLSSAVSHPSIICSSVPNPQPHSSLSSSSSCLASSVGGAVAPHSSHIHHISFQPMDPIPDLTFSDVSQALSSCSGSFGYPSFSSTPHTSHVRGCLLFLYHLLSSLNTHTHHCSIRTKHIFPCILSCLL